MLKLSRSISVYLQKLGRQMFINLPTSIADDSHENSGNGNGISNLQDGFNGDPTSIKKVPNKPQQPLVTDFLIRFLLRSPCFSQPFS